MRKKWNSETIEHVMMEISYKVYDRLEEKGDGGYASSHEIYGIIKEEMNELLDAITENDADDIRSECIDIAVACIFGIASIDDETVDWC